ncbi:MAG: acyl--CoA ligase [Thermoplasmatales archaeon]|nr:acyl--CoA ligase [Thermoplasmatales archaeon]MCW6170402.1 acyl--CoA ligase [Thermoplasmatales archaeon]
MVSLASYLDRSVLEHAKNIAVEESGRQITYNEYGLMAEKLSLYLSNIGLSRNDRIGILLPMSVDYLVSFYAAWKIGAVAVPINNRFSADDIEFVMRDAHLKGLFLSAPEKEKLAPLLGQNQSIKLVIQGNEHEDNSFSHIYANEQSGGTSDESWALDDDDAMIMYTSGTTGKPKGVRQSHRNNSASIHMVMDAWKLKETDILLNNVPLFHVGGLQCGTFPAMFSGGKVILLPKWNATDWLDLSINRKATWSGLVSTMVVDTVNAIKSRENIRRDEFSYRFIFFGGSPTPSPVISYFEKFFKIPLREIYGLTEATGLVISYDEGQTWKLGSMGYIMRQVAKYRVVKPESLGKNSTLIDSKEGVLLLQGDTITTGYLNRAELDQERFIDGWFNTKDIVRIDDSNLMYYLGRIDEMIISGGENVYPQEVESLIASHPGVKEVAVIGTPHERWIEAVTAIVVPKNDELSPDDVIKFCEESTSLASYKWPKRVFVVNELPKTGSGKINKAALKEVYANKNYQPN